MIGVRSLVAEKCNADWQEVAQISSSPTQFQVQFQLQMASWRLGTPPPKKTKKNNNNKNNNNNNKNPNQNKKKTKQNNKQQQQQQNKQTKTKKQQQHTTNKQKRKSNNNTPTTHTCSTFSLPNLPMIAIETVPMLARFNIDGSDLKTVSEFFLVSSFLQAIAALIILSVHAKKTLPGWRPAVMSWQGFCCPCRNPGAPPSLIGCGHCSNSY